MSQPFQNPKLNLAVQWALLQGEGADTLNVRVLMSRMIPPRLLEYAAQVLFLANKNKGKEVELIRYSLKKLNETGKIPTKDEP